MAMMSESQPGMMAEGLHRETVPVMTADAAGTEATTEGGTGTRPGTETGTERGPETHTHPAGGSTGVQMMRERTGVMVALRGLTECRAHQRLG